MGGETSRLPAPNAAATTSGTLLDTRRDERVDERWRRSTVSAITSGAVEGAPNSTTARALA